jgi:hypothetical protein
MNVRPFDWHDLPSLHRLRNESIFLDSALVLTRGPLLVPGALLSSLAPSMGLFTGMQSDDHSGAEQVIGQLIHPQGSQFAHLTFLTPLAALDSPSAASLLDYMATISGERGALRMLADVDEHTQAFDALRKCGFAVYNRQRIWQLTGRPPAEAQPGRWRTATSQDALAIRSLYNDLVPALVQQAEPFGSQRPRGVVYCREGELLAFVELRYGGRGIWVQPFVHPDAEDVSGQFIELMNKIPNRRSRPLYVCVRSYQSWLEPLIEDLGAEAGPRQAVMVRHLAVAQKAVRAFALPALEGGQPEITAPIVRSESK